MNNIFIASFQPHPMFRIGRYGYIILALSIIGAVLLASVYTLNLGQLPTDNINDFDAADLTYYTEQFPPYNYQKSGTLYGISINLLEEVTERMGRKVTAGQVHLSSWTEGYQAAQTSKNTVLFSTVRLQDREQLFKWAGPIYTDRYVLFAGWDKEIVINNPVDLKGYRIGVVTDDSAVLQLLNIGVNESQLVHNTNASALVEKLSQGEIDLWCYPESSGRFIAEQVTGNYYSFKAVFTLENIDFYYTFSKDIPDSFVEAFQQSLDALKQEKDAAGISIYNRILGRYIPAIGLAQLSYLTEDWAPFNYQNGPNPAGISVEIIEAIFRNSGVDHAPKVNFVPLSEGFQQVKENTNTVLFSIARTPEREALYKWAGPFTKSTFVVYAPSSSNITISSPNELNGYRIGVVEATVEKDLLTKQGVNEVNIVTGLTPSELLQMLKEGQIDLWATGDLTGHYEMNKAEFDTTAYEIVYTLGENEFYFIFSKDVPDMLVSAFQHAIEVVRNHKDAQGVSEYERIIYRSLGVGYSRQLFNDESVMALVDTAAVAIEKNATDTFRRINAAEVPYWDPEKSGLYVFVYDTNATMVAHADNILLVGDNFKGKTDVTGKPFRDHIIAGALENKTGWEEYVYINPAQSNLYYKTTYYRLANGNDGNLYIVCSGNFKSK